MVIGLFLETLAPRIQWKSLVFESNIYAGARVLNGSELLTYWELASNQGIYDYERLPNFKMYFSDLRNSQHSARETAMSAARFRDLAMRTTLT